VHVLQALKVGRCQVTSRGCPKVTIDIEMRHQILLGYLKALDVNTTAFDFAKVAFRLMNTVISEGELGRDAERG
jgi:hypothetical protein